MDEQEEMIVTTEEEIKTTSFRLTPKDRLLLARIAEKTMRSKVKALSFLIQSEAKRMGVDLDEQSPDSR